MGNIISYTFSCNLFRKVFITENIIRARFHKIKNLLSVYFSLFNSDRSGWYNLSHFADNMLMKRNGIIVLLNRQVGPFPKIYISLTNITE